jgi:clostripain
MVKFKRLLGVIMVMALLLMSSATFVTQLAIADDGEGEPRKNTLCEACGMGIEAIPIEEVEPNKDTSGLVSIGPTHMVLEDMVEISRAEPVEETGPFPTGWQTIMSDGFEGAFPGVWSIYYGGTEAYWGKDSYRSYTGSYSAFCAKGGSAGVDPPANYPNNMDTWMEYGPFSLADATDAKVDFWFWLDSESSYDYFGYMASIDGTNFYGTGWSGYSDGWIAESFDLTTVPTLGNLCGESQVWIVFTFDSDDTVNYDGAFIDDVVLQKYVGAVQFDLEAAEVYLSTQAGDTDKNYVVGTPTVGQEVYFHFKWNCYGSGTTPEFRLDIELDGTPFCYNEYATGDGGYSYTTWCNSPWTATADSHTLTGVLDVNDDISESNEANNEASKSWGGEPPEATWTFMAYLDGDNNLEDVYITNFERMETASSNPDVNIVVQFDRVSGESTDYGDWTDCRRFLITPGVTPAPGNEVQILGEVNMADPNTLIDFVNWAKTNYPADHYCLALMNHGGGWEPTIIQESTSGQELVPTGILWDDSSGDYMSTSELGSALSSATSGGTEKLDVVFLDACLMHMIEVEYEIKDYTDYIVASEMVGWAPGPYHNYISSITSSTTAVQLAATIVNEYHNYLTGNYPHTMSAVDVAEEGNLASAVDNFAQALIGGLPTYKTEIENSRTGCQKFDSSANLVISNNDEYLDLYHFAFLVDQNIADGTIQSAAQAVMTAVNNAVGSREQHESGTFSYGGSPYTWDLDNSHGISIYFPSSDSSGSYSSYNDGNLSFVADKSWDEFLTAFFNPEEGEVNISLEPSTKNVVVGEIFELIIQAEAGDQPVSGIDAFVDFDPTYLEVQSVTPGSSLPTVLENSYDNMAGTIDYSAGKLGAPFPTGTFTVATIQFRALAQTSPNTALTFSIDPPRQTRADYAGDDVTGTLTGGTVTITADAPLFLDPASSEGICIGQTFTLEVKTNVDSEQPVSGVQAFIDFDPIYLEVLSVTPGASLPTVLGNTYDNIAGTIDYSAGKLGAPFPNGEFTVATIEFEALAETSGTTAVTFSFTGPRTSTVDFGGSPIPGIHGDATVEIIPGAIVDVSVVFQGSSRPPEAWEVPITIKFFSPGADVMIDTPIYEFNLTTTKSDGTATCQCVGVMPGTCDITAQASNCPECEEGNCTLMNLRQGVVISAPSTAVDMGILLAGDANCNGIININDFGILAVSYMCIEGEPCYDCRADFDCNGIINISDFGLLAVNYMQISPIDISV